jgi:hypothetical protein
MSGHLRHVLEDAAETQLPALLDQYEDNPPRALAEAMLLGARLGAAEATSQAIEQGCSVTLSFDAG